MTDIKITGFVGIAIIGFAAIIAIVATLMQRRITPSIEFDHAGGMIYEGPELILHK